MKSTVRFDLEHLRCPGMTEKMMDETGYANMDAMMSTLHGVDTVEATCKVCGAGFAFSLSFYLEKEESDG